MKGGAIIQVSNDSPVKFIGAQAGNTNDGKAYYRITTSEETGDVFRSYCDVDVYNKVHALEFGTPVQLVIDVYQSKSGTGVRIKDVVY